MFVAVTMVALACAGLIYRTSIWASIVVTLTFALYAVVAIRAFGFSGAKRASALSFSFAGIAYLLLATCSLFTGVRELLLTNYPIAFAAQQAAARNPFAFSDSPWAPYPAYSRPSTVFSSSVVLPSPATTATFTPIPPPYGAPSSATTSETTETPDASADSGASNPTILDGSISPAPVQPPAISTTTGTISVSSYTPGATVAYAPAAAFPTASSTALLDGFIASSAMNSSGSALGRFFLVGHCLWSWLIAIFAAWFAGRVYARRELSQAKAA
jgi:hypothetical protein